MKKKKKTVLPKYEFGTMVDNPYTDLAQNDIAMARATMKAENNPWAKGLDLLGNMAIQYGTSMMNKGASKGQGVSKGGTNWGNMLTQGTQIIGGTANASSQGAFETGGIPGGGMLVPINAEGGEVVETPGGKVGELNGASHANGGIDMLVPGGTEIYSKKLKGPDGKTMADRKLEREKKLKNIQKQLEKNPSDKALKNAYKRIKMSTELDETEDMSKMQLAKNMNDMMNHFMTGGKVEEYAYGGPVNPYANGYGYNQFSPYFNLYGTQVGGPVDWTDIENRKNFQTAVGTNPDGIFGPDTLAKAQSYYQNPSLATPPINGGTGREILQPITPMGIAGEPNTGITPGMTPEAMNKDLSAEAAGLGSMNGDTPQDPNSFWNGVSNTNLGLTGGDAVGFVGDLISTFGPGRNTQANRAGDTPNVNAFKDYGKDGLKRLDDSKQFQAGIRDNAIKDVELTRNSTITRNRNTARGINTIRALDLAAEAGINKVKAGIQDNYGQIMQGILGQQAQFENIQDDRVMRGEEGRDLADRQDRDNYFTQMGRDIATKGTGISTIGKNMNQIKTRNVTEKALNSLSPDFDINALTGEMKKQVTNTKSNNSEALSKVPQEHIDQAAYKLATKEWINKNGVLYSAKTGKKIDFTKN